MTTILSINGIAMPDYAARGISEELRPIGQSVALRRTVNGTLVDLSVAELRKYQLSLTCTDQASPAFNSLWPGASVVIDCITELTYVTSGGSAGRTAVPGSSRTEGAFTFYRPRLTCRVTDYNITTDEYGAAVGWTLAAEEV